jgi:hypothetical protein
MLGAFLIFHRRAKYRRDNRRNKVSRGWGMTRVVFDHNAFWGQFKSRPTDVHAVISNPRLAAPGSLRSRGYAPGPGSPCLNAGIPIFDKQVHDFRGRLRKDDTVPSIGAFQTVEVQSVRIVCNIVNHCY